MYFIYYNDTGTAANGGNGRNKPHRALRRRRGGDRARQGTTPIIAASRPSGGSDPSVPADPGFAGGKDARERAVASRTLGESRAGTRREGALSLDAIYARSQGEGPAPPYTDSHAGAVG